jgi:hypothetical protein
VDNNQLESRLRLLRAFGVVKASFDDISIEFAPRVARSRKAATTTKAIKRDDKPKSYSHQLTTADRKLLDESFPEGIPAHLMPRDGGLS